MAVSGGEPGSERRFEPPPRAALIAGGLALAGLLAVFHLGFVLYAVVVIGLLAGLCHVVAFGTVRAVSVERRLPSDLVDSGEEVHVGLTLRNRGALPVPWVRMEEQLEPWTTVEGESTALVPVPAGGEVVLDYCLPDLRRGLYRLGPAVIEGSGPFGLVRRFAVAGGPGSVAFLTVRPTIVSLGKVLAAGERPLLERPRHTWAEDPSRFAGVRDFRPGDGLRRVHWRATARTGKLQSRVFEPAVLGGVLLCAEFSRDAWSHDPEGMELAATVLASVADVLLGARQRVGLFAAGADAAEAWPDEVPGGMFRRREDVAQTPEHEGPARCRPIELPADTGSAHRDTLLRALARLVPSDGPPLTELLSTEFPRLPRSLVTVLVVPSVDGPLRGLVGVLTRSGFLVRVVLVGEGSPGALGSVPISRVRDERDLLALGTIKW